jgi:hypothetical protein
MDSFPARDVRRRTPLRGLGLAVLLCGAAAATATGVYVTYDKDGRPQYSDRPQPGTQKVDVTPAQAYEAPKPAAPTAPAAAAVTPVQAAAPGPACRIVSPLPDEVFLNVESLTVTAIGPPRATPSLQLNGNLIQSEDGKPVFTIKPIPRGTYTATVTFSGGTVGAACRTATVTFHVRQPSVIKPATQPRPNAGR